MTDPKDNDEPDSEAFDWKDLERYQAEIHRYLMRRIDNPHDVQDCVQQTFEALIKAWRRLTRIEHPLRYLYKTAARVAANLRARQRRSYVRFDSTQAEKEAEYGRVAADPWRNIPQEALESLQQIEALVRKLSDREAQIYQLDRWAELSSKQIAERLGVSRAIAAKRKTSFRRKLRAFRKED